MDNTVARDITQNLVSIGHKTSEAEVKVLEGEKLPKAIYTSFYWHSKSNINDRKIAPLFFTIKKTLKLEPFKGRCIF